MGQDEEEPVHALELRGFTLFMQNLKNFDTGLHNLVTDIKFLKRNPDGSFIVAFPINWNANDSAHDAELKNPIAFLAGFMGGIVPQLFLVQEPAIVALGDDHHIAKFDLGNFVAVVRKKIASSTANPLSNDTQISEELNNLVEKAKTANLIPPQDFDAWLQQAVADHMTGADRRRALGLDEHQQTKL